MDSARSLLQSDFISRFRQVKHNGVATCPSPLICREFSSSLELESCTRWRKRRNWCTARRDWQHRSGPKCSRSATAMNTVIGRALAFRAWHVCIGGCDSRLAYHKVDPKWGAKALSMETNGNKCHILSSIYHITYRTRIPFCFSTKKTHMHTSHALDARCLAGHVFASVSTCHLVTSDGPPLLTS